MSGLTVPEVRAPKRRRRPAFIGGVVLAGALCAVLVTVAASSTVRARYYFWRLERAYLALPYGSTAASPKFNSVLHYQSKLAREGEAAADLLLESRHKHDNLWYWVTTTAVGIFHPPRAEEPLVADTRSESWAIVQQAVRTLRALPTLHCQARILELLGHPSAGVRAGAVCLVTEHRVKEAYPTVVTMLQSDPAVMVRALSAHAVTRLGGRKAIPLLIQALDDPGAIGPGSHLSVEEAARFWLQVLTGQAFVDKEEWQQWWREHGPKDAPPSSTDPAAAVPTTDMPETTCPEPGRTVP